MGLWCPVYSGNETTIFSSRFPYLIAELSASRRAACSSLTLSSPTWLSSSGNCFILLNSAITITWFWRWDICMFYFTSGIVFFTRVVFLIHIAFVILSQLKVRDGWPNYGLKCWANFTYAILIPLRKLKLKVQRKKIKFKQNNAAEHKKSSIHWYLRALYFN